MATLFVISASAEPSYVGISRKPERELEAIVQARGGEPALKLVYQHRLPTIDAAQYVERVLNHRLHVEGAAQDETGWWIGLTTPEVVDVCRETIRLFEHGPVVRPGAPEAMRSLRLGVFQVSMSTFAQLAHVSVSQVSRWESGEQIPDYLALGRLRLHAIEAGLTWPKQFPITLSDDARSGSSNVVPFRRAEQQEQTNNGEKTKRSGRTRDRRPEAASSAHRK